MNKFNGKSWEREVEKRAAEMCEKRGLSVKVKELFFFDANREMLKELRESRGEK